MNSEVFFSNEEPFFRKAVFSLDPDFEAFLFGGSTFSGKMSSLSVACVVEAVGLLKKAVIRDISSNER